MLKSATYAHTGNEGVSGGTAAAQIELPAQFQAVRLCC